MKKLLLILPFVFLLFLNFSCQQKVEEGITEEEVQAFNDHILDMWNNADLTIADEVYAPEIVRHDCNVPEAIVGIDNVKDFVDNLFKAFPDLNLTIDEVIVEGNRMAQKWTMTGTNTGSINGMPPTGKSVHFSGVSIGHFVDKKLVEIWDFYNALDMVQQLGFTLTPPQFPEPQEEKK